MIKLRLLIETFNHSSYEEDYAYFLKEIANGIKSESKIRFHIIPRDLFVSAWMEYGKYGHIDEDKLSKVWDLMKEDVIKLIIVGRDAYGEHKIPDRFLTVGNGKSYVLSICWPKLTDDLERQGYNAKTTDELVMAIDRIMTLSHSDWPLACSFIEGAWDTLDKIRDFTAKGIRIAGNISEKKYE